MTTKPVIGGPDGTPKVWRPQSHIFKSHLGVYQQWLGNIEYAFHYPNAHAQAAPRGDVGNITDTLSNFTLGDDHGAYTDQNAYTTVAGDAGGSTMYSASTAHSAQIHASASHLAKGKSRAVNPQNPQKPKSRNQKDPAKDNLGKQSSKKPRKPAAKNEVEDPALGQPPFYTKTGAVSPSDYVSGASSAAFQHQPYSDSAYGSSPHDPSYASGFSQSPGGGQFFDQGTRSGLPPFDVLCTNWVQTQRCTPLPRTRLMIPNGTPSMAKLPIPKPGIQDHRAVRIRQQKWTSSLPTTARPLKTPVPKTRSALKSMTRCHWQMATQPALRLPHTLEESRPQWRPLTVTHTRRMRTTVAERRRGRFTNKQQRQRPLRTTRLRQICPKDGISDRNIAVRKVGNPPNLQYWLPYTELVRIRC
jgi:hypothetical protein